MKPTAETGRIFGYKGFDRDLKCRGMQYEVGKTFEHEGKVEVCNSGLHFCENPLDVFAHYDPTSRFAEVEAEECSERESESDSKRAAKRLHIRAEVSLIGMIDGGVKFILDRVDFANAKEFNTGYRSAATNTGNRSAATNTGDLSAATNTGEEGCAISLGIEGRASGAKGCWITLAEWKDGPTGWHRKDVKTVKVDGKKIKADTFYMLKRGKFVEVK